MENWSRSRPIRDCKGDIPVFIGAALGNTLAVLLGAPVDLFAVFQQQLQIATHRPDVVAQLVVARQVVQARAVAAARCRR